MKTFFLISALIFVLSNFICCNSSVEKKQPVDIKETVLKSGIEKTGDKEADETVALEGKGLSSDEIEKINKIREVIAANRSIIENQVREAFNTPVKIKIGDEVTLGEKKLKERLKNIEINLEDLPVKDTVGKDKNVKEPIEFTKDELLIKFKDGLSTQSIQVFANEHNLEMIREVNGIKVIVFNVRGGRSILSVCKELNEDPLVEYAEPNFKVRANTIAK